MAVLRIFAGPHVHRYSPTGVLLASAVVSGIGLYALSYAQSGVAAMASATVFAVGVTYFWPTMLGFVSERVPRSGALGLGLMGAIGMATVGLISSPWMGGIADRHSHDRLPVEATLAVMEEAASFAPEGTISPDAIAAAQSARSVIVAYNGTGELPEGETAAAFRTIISSGVESPAVERAGEILQPADNYGGRVSFRRLVPMCFILAIIFGGLYYTDRRSGGYRIKHISEIDEV
jgi:hypothetical protein